MEIVTYIDNSVSIPESSSVGAFRRLKRIATFGKEQA